MSDTAYKTIEIPYIQFNGTNGKEIEELACSDHIGDYRFTYEDGCMKIHGYNGYCFWTLTVYIGYYVFIDEKRETNVLSPEAFAKSGYALKR